MDFFSRAYSHSHHAHSHVHHTVAMAKELTKKCRTKKQMVWKMAWHGQGLRCMCKS